MRLSLRGAGLSLIPCASLVLAAPARAGDLDLKLVDAEACVVLHADVEQLVKTKLYSLLYERHQEEIRQAMIEFEAELGLDPLRDVRSVTAYGLSAESSEWVALVHASDRLDAAVARLKEQPGYAPVEVDGRTLLSLEQDDESWVAYVGSSEDRAERLLLLSESAPSLVRAIEVVEGKRRSVDEEPGPKIDLNPSPHSVVFVSAATKLSQLSEFEQAAEVSKLILGFTIDCGEASEALFARATLRTASHDDALKIYQVLQGGLALLSLIAATDENAAGLNRLIAALDIQRVGMVVSLAVQYGSVELFEALEALDEG